MEYKYKKYKKKYYKLKRIQKGGNYLLNLNEDDECGMCMNKLIDVCIYCEKNGNNFSPNPRHDYKKGETDPRNCQIDVGRCGHVFHAHCLGKIGNNKCPTCREEYNVVFATIPKYVWCSGQIGTEQPLGTIQNKDNELGGKWKNVQLSNIIDLIKTKQPIAKYIYKNTFGSYYFSKPEMYPLFIKQYEDSIPKKEN